MPAYEPGSGARVNGAEAKRESPPLEASNCFRGSYVVGRWVSTRLLLPIDPSPPANQFTEDTSSERRGLQIGRCHLAVDPRSPEELRNEPRHRGHRKSYTLWSAAAGSVQKSN